MATKADDNPKNKAIELAIEQIQKQFGKGAIMKLGDGPSVPAEVLSTGILPLDLALGVGGIPKGRIIELYGPEASGKTTITLSLIAEAQRTGGTAAFIDAEHAMDPSWAENLGVKLDQLLISQPDTGEQALEIVETLVRSGGVDLIVVDSVAALVPRAEIEGEMGDSQMGLQARLMSQALRKLTAIVAKSKTIVIFINQIRMQIGVMFGNPETTPGGKALKFYTSIRLDIRRIAQIKKGEDIMGGRVRVKVVKNKVAAPFRQTEFTINSEGIDRVGALIDVGVSQGIIEKNGSFFKYGGTSLGQGIEQSKLTLEQDPKLKEKISREIYATLPNKKGQSSGVQQKQKDIDKQE